jgi:cell division protein FtsW
MAKRVGVDKWLFGTVLLLVLFGLTTVFSASAVMAKAQYGTPYHFILTQALWGALGLLALLIFMQVDYRHYNTPRVVFPAIGLTTLLLIGVFVAPSSHHTHRWFHIGGLGTFQPSELATPVVILFLAYFLQTRLHKMDDYRNTILRAVAPPLLLLALILKEPDLGTALVCGGVTLVILYLAACRCATSASASCARCPCSATCFSSCPGGWPACASS